MPEAAEVRRVSDMLNTASDRTITAARVMSGRYVRAEIHGLQDLVGAVIERVLVKGKLLTFALRKQDTVFAALSTLGMTGWWYRMHSHELKEHVASYQRVELQLDDGSSLVFVDQRNFGTFRVVSWAMARAKQLELGPDIMSPKSLWTIALPEFSARIDRFAKSQTVAEALLDQRIVAGVGNYIRADAMHLASMSPHRLMSSLDDKERVALWEAITTIANAAYHDVHPLDPSLGYTNLCYGQPVGLKGGTIETFTDKNGRTVWYCPSEQP